MADNDSSRPSIASKFGQFLNKLGLTKKAARVEEQFRKIFHRDGNNDTWSQTVNWESGIRTSRRIALEKSRERIRRYAPLRQVLGDSFAVLRIAFPVPEDVLADASAKMFLFNTRRLIKRLVPNSFDLIGSWRHGREIIFKVISLDPLTPEQAESIQLALSRRASLTWSNKSARDYDLELRRSMLPDLPEDDWDRAKFEYLIDHIQQSTEHGTVYATIRNKKLPEYQSSPNPLIPLPPARPKNPQTGAIALCYTLPKSMETEVEDLDPSDWLQYVDFYEIDTSTAADLAEMEAAWQAEYAQAA